MQSGTSFFDWTTFKKTIFRFWPLWGVYLAGWIITLPLNGLMMLRLDANAIQGIDYGYMRNFALYTVPRSVTGGGMVTFVFFGALAAMAVFSHLYNPRSANLFGSLPIRREGLFLTHWLAGLSFLIVPNIGIFLLTLAVEATGGAVCIEGLLFWLAAACGESFFFYTLAVFCAMFTGHILALPAFYLIVNFFVMGVTGLVYTVFRMFYYGFADFPDGVYTVVKWCTPTVRLYEAVDWEVVHVPREGTEALDGIYLKEAPEIRGLGTVGIYALAAVALAVCAFFLYRARRPESAGDVVAVRPMRPVFKYGVAFCMGLAFGMGTTMIIGGGDVTLMIAIVVWGVIGYFAAEMLLQKSFRVFRRWKGAAAVTAVFLALFLVVGFDLTGFETRVPDPDSVERVEANGLDVTYLGDSGDWSEWITADPEVIRMITVIHEAAVEQRDLSWEDWLRNSTNTSLYVTYHLKNGGTLSRKYNNVYLRLDEVNREGTAAWALQQLYENRELCWQMYGFDQLEDYLASGRRLAEVWFESDEGWTNDHYYGVDAEALLAAVKEDFFAGRIGARQVAEYSWDGYMSRSYPRLTFKLGTQEFEKYRYINIALTDTATSTRAALEELAPAAESDWPDTEDMPADW